MFTILSDLSSGLDHLTVCVRLSVMWASMFTILCDVVWYGSRDGLCQIICHVSINVHHSV